MNISDYPRPSDDTGLGIHGGANGAYPLGENEGDWQSLIDELKQMGFKWFKLTVFGNRSVGLCALLVANGIMPIVRFYEPAQCPDALVDRQPNLPQWVREYVAVGVHYFEVVNEPNLFDEWKGGYGDEWKAGAQPDRVIRAWARDAEVVLDNGGLPGLPALSPGGHYNDVEFFRTMTLRLRIDGRADLLRRGAWIAIHNGTLNHPLDYPGDVVNQTGKAVTPEEYAGKTWAGDINYVNDERTRGKNPGQHLLSVGADGKDAGGSNCWDKFKAYRDIFFATFGFEIPILSTEGGVWIGEWIGGEEYNLPRIYDPRYPAVSKQMQCDWTIEICKKMMAGGYPAYYLCTGFWLFGNRRLGNPHMPFERDAWLSHYWDDNGGKLPVVDVLKALPKQVRPLDVPAQPPAPAVLSDEQIASLCYKHGYRGKALTIMVAIILAESNGDTSATNSVGNDPPGSEDVGLCMINLAWHPDVTREQALDPDFSVGYSWVLSQGGTYWGHWAAYNAGTYLQEGRWERALAVTPADVPTATELGNAAWNMMGVRWYPEAASFKLARDLGLGIPLTNEEPLAHLPGWMGQVFSGPDGAFLVYWPEKNTDAIDYMRVG